MSAAGVFVAGTDTEVGKTFVACALLRALRERGLRASGMKPVASGSEPAPDGLRNPDALALLEASDPRPDYATCNPFAFAEPVSPHLAAPAHALEVTLAPIEAAYARLAAQADVVVVEGVGGWQAPLSPRLLASALPQALRLPVVLVVGLRLGCLNHAQLSARAILADGCPLLGWVANRIDAGMLRPDDNLAALRALLPAPCLGVVPAAADAAQATAALAEAARAVANGAGTAAPAGLS
ncbi:MAG TPA: dethiobiotin synthase [Rhodanobacteraceae bacterium]|nr:dethiobiotin synthase [Rhodanobacteraceae bacterium]